jgi:DNA (cytosine-5)-methyltransferase 1
VLRSDPEKVRAWQQRSRSNLARTPLAQQSPRKAGHRASIQRAATKAKKAAGYRCEAVELLPSLRCAGELETHHVIPRSTAPHLVTDPANLVALCHFHHQYVTDHPAEARYGPTTDPTMKPRLLDLFCKAGGASMGYHRAGFDVVGVDIEPQPHYPFEFHQADAMTFPLAGFDVVTASPPCQDHSTMRSMTGQTHGTGWMLAATVDRLMGSGLPWVVENVEGSGAEMGGQWTVLCGSTFGLGVRRHRLFRSSLLLLTEPCRHKDQGIVVGVYGHGQAKGARLHRHTKGLPVATVADWREAMGIDWMNRDELAQAIPPAYTEWIGDRLMAQIRHDSALSSPLGRSEPIG